MLLIVCLNGFFVIAEYGLLRSRRAKLEDLAETGENKASVVLRILDKQETYLSAIQLGITSSSVLLGILGGPLFARLLHAYTALDILLAWILSVIFVILLHVVLGELVPRAMARSNVEKAAIFVCYPLLFFHYLLYPFVIITSKASLALQKVLQIKKPAEDIARSEDELRRIVSASEQEGEIDHIESSMIDNVFDFADRVAREVMVPRQDMVCLYTDDTLQENLQAVRTSRHTRYPLCEEDKDHVIGTIHVRDLLNVKDVADYDLRQLMRPLVVIPEAMPISKALTLMQKRHVQMVLVADEYGGTAGLITMEDLVEEIVGEIQDEHELEEPADVVLLPNGNYEFDGMVLLDDITDILHIEFDDPEEDTIGGYVFGMLGRKPLIGDVVEIGGYCFRVLKTEGFRILRVQAEKLPEPPQAENEQDE